ncbi:MAG: hypothetical protein CSA22_03505 [Deltaproteobacteria bacterium]|nr:MAG: hypothetical protein CSA22_03505 [Deltaproteobacteria bacterium]
MPVVTGLKKQGANDGAALSFMIATPETGVDSIAVSWAMLDPVMTVFRPVAGFITAVSTGIVQNFFGTQELERSAPMGALLPMAPEGADAAGSHAHASADASRISSLPRRIIDGMRYAYGNLLNDIQQPFLFGILLAGLITFFFPEDFTLWTNEYPLVAMLIMLGVGIPMYVCATASTPIAAALILKGLNPGAALVFLLAGPATNAATMAVVKKLFNTRALLIYLGMITVCSLGMGLLVDLIYSTLNINAQVVVGQASALIPQSVMLGSAVLLAGLMAANWVKHTRLRRTQTAH